MSRALRWVAAMVAGALAPVGASCLVDDPDHCANRAGDRTCAELGADAFCSICASARSGCVAALPEPSCYEPGAPASTTTGGETDTSSGSVSGESGEETASPPDVLAAECSTSGADPACGETSPYCVDGVCVSCTEAGGNAYCADLDADAGSCHPDWGRCVGCVAATDCPDEVVCDESYECAECTQHADCGGGACDLELGVCFPRVNEYWVDRSGCAADATPAQDMNFGTLTTPYCFISKAVDNIGAGETGIVHLFATTPFDEGVRVVSRPDRRVAFVSVDGTAEVSGADVGLIANARSVAYVHNVRFNQHTTGIRCEASAQVWLEDVEIETTTTALNADNCEMLHVARTKLARNTGSAIDIANRSVLALESSFIVANGEAGAQTHALFATDAAFSVVSTTFAGNRGTFGATAFCTGSRPMLVRNSVLLSSDKPSFDCAGAELVDSVVDSGAVVGQGLVAVDYDADFFENIGAFDAHVASPGQSPFADVAVWALGDPRRDIDAEERLAYPGLLEFAGADQP